MTADDERLAQIRAMVGRAQVKHVLLDPTDPLDSPCDFDWCHSCMAHDLLTEVDRQRDERDQARAEVEQLRALTAGLRQQWGIQSDTGATLKTDDRATAERKATRYSKLRLPGGEAGQTFRVVRRLATDWQRVDAEQQPEDGDRG